MTIRVVNEPLLFTYEQLAQICKFYSANHVVDTEHDGLPVSVFYTILPQPFKTADSKYFSLHIDVDTQQLVIGNADWIEEQEFAGIIANNGDIIFSRNQYDRRVSADESVWIDGGRDFARYPAVNPDRLVKLSVFKGRLEVWFNDTN